MLSKKTILLATVLATLAGGITVHAATHSYGSWSHGAKSTERWHQLNYLGEAYTTLPGRTAGIYYYRNGAYLGGAETYKDPWISSGTRLYNSVVIWDSFNWNAPKTKFSIRL